MSPRAVLEMLGVLVITPHRQMSSMKNAADPPERSRRSLCSVTARGNAHFAGEPQYPDHAD